MISTPYVPNKYVGNNITSSYPYGFKVFSATHLKVIARNLLGAESVLQLGTDFTVTGVGNDNGGNVVLTNNLPTNYLLSITISVPVEQNADIRNQGDYYPEYIENALDYITMIAGQTKVRVDRALKVSDTTDLATFDTTLPTILGANRTVVVNEFGTGLAAGPTIQELSDAGAAVSGAVAAQTAALASASAAAASATSAMTSATAASNSATTAATSAASAMTAATNAGTSATNAATSATSAAAHDILYGTGTPGSGLGVDGNSYIDSATGSFYQKAAGIWSLKVTLTGSGGVSTFNTRSGAVVPLAGDYTPTMVGLGNVDNVSDVNKPVSTAQAAADALNLKIASNLSDLASIPTAKTNLGLNNVDNTTDLAKPISTATQTALNLKYDAATAVTDLALKANLAGGNSFTGIQTLDTDLIVGGYIRRSSQAGISAFAGGGQASATALTKEVNWVTTVATAGDSVKLPVSIAGTKVFVQNNGAQNANVFPAAGEYIDDGAVNIPAVLPAGSNATFVCVVNNTWKMQAGAGGGGTASPLTTKGDLYVFTTVNARLGVGANDTILTADSTTASGMKWAAPAPGFTGRAGVQTLSSAVQTQAITFSTALANTNYSVQATIENLTDADPIFLQFVVTVKSTTGFTVAMNAPTDSTNYKINWLAIPNA